MNGLQIEEKDIGKVFDRKIISRLFHFLKPYLNYVLISSVLLLIAAGAELALPYIIKVAIDKHIIINGRKVSEKIAGDFPEIEPNIFS